MTSTPGFDIKPNQITKPDPSDRERELKRQQALKLRPELAARIEQGIRERVPMKSVKSATD